MSRRKRRNDRLKKRVIQMELPSEHVSRPPRGDWSRFEQRAKQQLAAAAKAAGLDK